MTTLQKRLEFICERDGKPLPYAMHLEMISMAIVAKLKEMEVYSTIKKVKEIIMVNNYPASVYPIIDEAIQKYFDKLLTRSDFKVKKIKQFNYDIPAHKQEAFEAALKLCGMEVRLNQVKNGKAQYIIPVLIPSQLVGLGKAFQKERYNQERRERQAKRLNYEKEKA